MMFISESAQIVVMGALFGLSAGISPGPLLTLVITETLKHNRKEGIRIAIAPLITDLPIILVTALIFSGLSQYNIMLGIISILGGIYFAWLGYETITTKELTVTGSGSVPASLKKGITANFLNPNPYMFWLTAGIPSAWKAYAISIPTVILYFLSFYVMLVGSKIIIAFLAERSRPFLKKNIYSLIMKVLGAVLLLFALLFLRNGLGTIRGPL
jgi:threonine/homoserine/homoserine lactone efflux protein